MAGMDMGPDAPVSGARKAAVTLLMLLMLAGGYWLVARFGNLSMRPGGGAEADAGHGQCGPVVTLAAQGNNYSKTLQ